MELLYRILQKAEVSAHGIYAIFIIVCVFHTTVSSVSYSIELISELIGLFK